MQNSEDCPARSFSRPATALDVRARRCDVWPPGRASLGVLPWMRIDARTPASSAEGSYVPLSVSGKKSNESGLESAFPSDMAA